MLIVMLVLTVISIILGLLFIKFSKEDESIVQLSYFGLGIMFLFMASAGLLGMISKTFELWGNS